MITSSFLHFQKLSKKCPTIGGENTLAKIAIIHVWERKKPNSVTSTTDS